MLRLLEPRFPWLSLKHPLVIHESNRINHELPKLIRKLTDFWTMLGYAAMLHGLIFVLSLTIPQHNFVGLSSLFIPFLSPFGTPIAAGMLHSILYWLMLIGVCNYTVFLVGTDVQSNAWVILRTTPFPTTYILASKLVAVFYTWSKVLRSLLIVRLVILIVIPLGLLLERGREGGALVSFNLIGAGVFLAQPVVDALLIASLSTVAALLIPVAPWSKAAAYGLIAVVYGGLGLLGSLWLIFKSPMGTLGGLMAPLSHWEPLAATVIKPLSTNEFVQRTVASLVIYLVLPLVLSAISLCVAQRLSQRRN
ncbi:MAG: hypothetical protein ABI947_24525 [Chloroflexota bacterium]